MMQFAVGDKVVHPHHGPGRITGLERKQFLDKAKRYFVIQTLFNDMTVYVPRRNIEASGVRPAMSPGKMRRVLATLRGRPGALPDDYRERQEQVWEKLRTSHSLPVAEVVRDLTWHGRQAHLTKKDADYLQRGQQLLAAEMALATDSEVEEANRTIEAALSPTQSPSAAGT